MELKLTDWESFLYESRPFAYVALGVYAVSVDQPDIIVMGLAAILAYLGILVLRMRFAARKGASLPSLYYESLPFLYIGLGVYAVAFMNYSKVGVASGVILLFCATRVFHWRITYRREVLRITAKKKKDEEALKSPSTTSTSIL